MRRPARSRIELPGLTGFGHQETTTLFPARLVPLHAMLTSCGFAEERLPSYDWHGNRRGKAEFALFQYTLSGQGMLSVAGRPQVVRPGQAMLLHFPDDNRYWLEPGQHWEFFYLCINGREIMRLWRALVARSGPLVAFAISSPALRAAAKLCARTLRKQITSPFVASALVYDLMMALMEECMPAATEEPPSFIEPVVRFCHEHLAKPIGVDQLARAAGLSRYHFIRRFRQARGIPPGRFLGELRLQEAVRLIQAGDLPVKEVARRCGFNDANYFCKAFRKSFGVSPGAFRSSGMY